MRLQDGQKVEYRIWAPRGSKPEGTACVAWREGGKVVLEFWDGERVELDGDDYRIAGHEEPEGIVDIEDRRAFDAWIRAIREAESILKLRAHPELMAAAEESAIRKVMEE